MLVIIACYLLVITNACIGSEYTSYNNYEWRKKNKKKNTTTTTTVFLAVTFCHDCFSCIWYWDDTWQDHCSPKDQGQNKVICGGWRGWANGCINVWHEASLVLIIVICTYTCICFLYVSVFTRRVWCIPNTRQHCTAQTHENYCQLIS